MDIKSHITHLAAALHKAVIAFLLWLDEHSIGILATIAVHLLVIAVALVWKISAIPDRSADIMIDVSMLESAPPEKTPVEEASPELVQQLNETYGVRSIPVGSADRRAEENIRRMEEDIKREMNISDPPPVPEEAEEEEVAAEQKYNEQFPENEQGERTVYKGPTTVSYELSGRRHLWMPVPAYKCEGHGRIVVDIVVNQNGYVLHYEVNAALSDSRDPCLLEAALHDARRSRFNAAPTAPAKQQGTITYQFIAQ